MSVRSANRQTVLSLLAERAAKHGEFILASGRRREHYVDVKEVSCLPQAIEPIGDLLWDAIRPYQVSAVCGLAIGAVAPVIGVMHAALRKKVHVKRKAAGK